MIRLSRIVILTFFVLLLASCPASSAASEMTVGGADPGGSAFAFGERSGHSEVVMRERG